MRALGSWRLTVTQEEAEWDLCCFCGCLSPGRSWRAARGNLRSARPALMCSGQGGSSESGKHVEHISSRVAITIVHNCRSQMRPERFELPTF